MKALWIACLVAVAACGGGEPKKPERPIEKPKPVVKKPPPPPPVCIKGGDAMGAIGGATGDATSAAFCVSDGSSNECFSADLDSGKFDKLAEPPAPQPAAVTPPEEKVETTATEVKICKGEECTTLTPKVKKGSENQLVAVANGALAVVMLGDAEAGKGTAEVWDVVKRKKLSTIKYAKGDFKCGVPRLLGNAIYISASVCSGPAARAALYTTKGKKLADVGGKDFGSYSEVAVQVKDNVWAFLEENGSAIALQDVVTGKVAKTISLAPLWAPESAAAPAAPAEGEAAEGEAAAAEGEAAPAEAADPAAAMGNPGETALVRGADFTLLAIAGSPSTGTIGVVDIASGEVKVIRAPTCKE
jgi:hypothetical protein